MSDNRKLEFFYIRHADTTNATSEDRDPCDITISELGQKQIQLLAKRFFQCEFDAVLCSPLVRCVQTAAAICKELKNNPTIEIVPAMIEKGSTPLYCGCSVEYLRRYYPQITLCPDIIYGESLGVFSNETDHDANQRANALTKYLKERFSFGQKILLICHGSFANHFLPASVGMAPGNYILSINNTSVSKIKYTEDGKQRLSFVNDFSHLRPLMPDYEFTV